ncbi:MAG TPA: glycosyltransferase family 39 protein [Tepidisphaeraceae bacterium]|jgi:4-amino-4-deoxy-L-arabinose transferase-like glycosyltransferase
MIEPANNAAGPNSTDVSPRRAWALALLIAATFFAAVAPTLNWLQFSSGNENLVVQAALEMRHGGPKLLPQLMGEPRVKKPPFVTWVTAAAMRPETVSQLSDEKLREQAYRDLAWQARWPALVAACVLTLAAFETARVWGGGLCGVMTAMVVCTNYLFLKYMRQSTTDAHLAAWVAVANICFAHALLHGRWWLAATGGALATGFAFMCKGPVALVETIVPTMAMAAVLHWPFGGRRNRTRAGESPDPSLFESLGVPASAIERRRPPRVILKCIVGLLLFAAVALPWFIYVMQAVPNVAATWKTEVGREGATALERSNPLVYLQLGALTAPWLAFAAVGLWALWQRRRERAAWLPFVFSVAPLLVMVWFRDRKERYMLPMIVPAAIICGYGVVTWVRSWRTNRTRADWAVLVVHSVTLVGAAVTLLVHGVQAERVDGGTWYSMSLAAWGGAALLAFVGLTAIALRRHATALPVATFLLMLGLLTSYNYGYRDSVQGRSPLKPIADTIRAEAPGAAVYDWLPRGRADEQIPLYLNHTVLRPDDPAKLVPIDRPIVLITRQGTRDASPAFGPEWQLLATANEGAVKWFAFVRRP